MHIRFWILNGMLLLLEKSRETYPESSQVLVGGWSSYRQSDDSSGHCTLAFSLSHEPWQSEDQVFLEGNPINQVSAPCNIVEFLKVLLLAVLCIALFLLWYFYPTIRQWQDENLGGKMLEHVAWFARLLIASARSGQNRMRKVGKRENVKFLSHIYFRNLRRDIYWIYVSNLLRRRFHTFHPFSPKRIRVSKEKAGRRGKRSHQSSSILDWCHPCTSERWGQTLDKFPHEQSCLDSILQAIRFIFQY